MPQSHSTAPLSSIQDLYYRLDLMMNIFFHTHTTQASSSCSLLAATFPLQAGSAPLPAPPYSSPLLPASSLSPSPLLPTQPPSPLHANRLLPPAGDVPLLHLPAHLPILPAPVLPTSSPGLSSTLFTTSTLSPSLPGNELLLTKQQRWSRRRMSRNRRRRSALLLLRGDQGATCQSQSLHKIQCDSQSRALLGK